jgi:hypothetical protein
MSGEISERKNVADSNFQRAKDQLLKRLRRSSGFVDFKFKFSPTGNELNVESVAADLEGAVEEFIKLRKLPTTGIGTMTKTKKIMGSMLRATYPFIYIFLSAAKAGSSVRNSPILLLTARLPEALTK